MSSLNESIPADSWVLVTGATGFVASHVTKQLLERGYKVLGTVRDLSQASWLLEDHFKSYSDEGKYKLITVPDLASEGAFDKAVQGVSGIVHLATITNFDPDPNQVVTPAVKGVSSILKSAMKAPSVKRFVFTSSIMAAFVPVAASNGTHVDRDTWNKFAVDAAWAPPPYEAARAFMTYGASKVAAEKEVWKFVGENKPSFSVNTILPSGIIGEPMCRKHAETPTNWILTLWNGVKEALDPFPASFFVDVKDISLLHIAALLDPNVKSERLHTYGNMLNWNEFLAVLRHEYPEKEFIADYDPAPDYLTITVDQTLPVALLKRWAGHERWRPLRDSISAAIENKYFPRT